MAQKKIIAASALAVAALAGCTAKPAETNVSAPAPVAKTTETPVAKTTETPVAVEVSTGTAVSNSGSSEILFAQPYDYTPGKQAVLKGKIVLENGIVKSIEVPDAKGPIAAFAAGVGEKAYGKPVKGLQIDTVSGASLTSAAFNVFLKTVN